MAINQKKNAYHCFGLKDTYIVIIIAAIALLPFISILVLNYIEDYNSIKWDEYYGTKKNYSSYVTGASVNYNEDTVNQQYKEKSDYKEYDLSGTLITAGMRLQYFLSNGSSDITFVSQYEFDSKMEYIYYPFSFTMPLSLLLSHVYTMYNETSHTYDTYYDFSTTDFFIPSNWSDVWDQMEIYFYYVDENNDGVAFSYGNTESVDSVYRNVDLDTDYGKLNLKTFDLNVSCEQTSFTKNGTYKNWPQFVYHNKPLEGNSFIFDYLQFLAGDSSFDPNNMGFSFVQLLGTSFAGMTIGVEDIYSPFTYDNNQLEVMQIPGYPSLDNYPSQKSQKCGFYIRIKQDFNITQYFTTFPIGFMDEYVNSMTSTLVNGISFTDFGLYLGRIISINSKIQTLVVYDLLYLVSVICVIMLTSMLFHYPDRKDEFKSRKAKLCVVD